MAKKELSIDEHNKQVMQKVQDLKDQIKELELTYRSEAEKKQASLHECNALHRKKHK